MRHTGLEPRTGQTGLQPTHVSLASDRGTHNVAERESTFTPKENVLLAENTGWLTPSPNA